MSIKPKKELPKIKKNLSGFLTPESSKIKKLDALALAVGALALLWGVSEAAASHSSSITPSHSNAGSHGNGGIQSGTASHVNGNGIDGTVWYNQGFANCAVSQVVNWHVSGSIPSQVPGTADISGWNIMGTNLSAHSNSTVNSHASHGSHGSHGSHAAY